MVLSENWEFDVLKIYNYRKDIQLKYYFDFVLNNDQNIDGDIIEAGVFQGKAILGMGLMLKELGSKKKIYGFDSFSGFPPIYSPYDDLSYFDLQFKEGIITEQHYAKIKRNISMRSLQVKEVNEKSISLSGDFSENNLELLKSKIEYLGLDNIELVVGDFATTMQGNFNGPISCVLFDCDLYESYKTCLNYVWPSLVSGGMCYFDEYYSLKFPGARKAADNFFATRPEKISRHPLITGDFERWSVVKH